MVVPVGSWAQLSERGSGRDLVLREVAAALRADGTLSMHQIAEHCSISRATFFRHFGTREALMIELERTSAQRAVEALDDAWTPDGHRITQKAGDRWELGYDPAVLVDAPELDQVTYRLIEVGRRYWTSAYQILKEPLPEQQALIKRLTRVLERGQMDRTCRADMPLGHVYQMHSALMITAVAYYPLRSLDALDAARTILSFARDAVQPAPPGPTTLADQPTDALPAGT